MTNESYVQKIRATYGEANGEKNVTDIEAIRILDAKVKRPANIFGYVFGSISAVIMGCGMSLVMTDIGEIIGLSGLTVYGVGAPLFAGITVGVVGLILSLLTYPIYSGILKSRKKKYAPEILELSDRILNK